MTPDDATPDPVTPPSMVDVALLAFGGPADLTLVPDFLVRMTGRTPGDETLAVVRERYTAIGGASPLPEITARQARALQAKLVQELAFPLRVRHGFLFAEPGVERVPRGTHRARGRRAAAVAVRRPPDARPLSQGA